MILEERLDQPNPFADDDGTVAQLLAEALACDDVVEKSEAIVRALSSARIFVAVFPPIEGESEARQGSVEIAGREALAIFSDAEAVAAFSEQARPLPLLGRNAAAQALMASGIVCLNPADTQATGGFLLGRSACAAIASADEWLAPWNDEEIRACLREAVRVVERLIDVWLRPTPNGAVLIALQMSETSSRSDAERATVLISHALSHDEYLSARLDLVHIVPVRTA